MVILFSLRLLSKKITNPGGGSCGPLNSDLAVTQKGCEKEHILGKIIGTIRVEVEGHFCGKKIQMIENTNSYVMSEEAQRCKELIYHMVFCLLHFLQYIVFESWLGPWGKDLFTIAFLV